MCVYTCGQNAKKIGVCSFYMSTTEANMCVLHVYACVYSLLYQCVLSESSVFFLHACHML